MAKARVASGLLAGCLLLWGGAAQAAPTVAQMLTFKPRQEGVALSTPTKEEESGCTVSLVQGSRPGSSGWLLSDGQKRPLRRFFDSNGDKKIDIWSYYKDGVEVYREIDTNANDSADQYRWLNAGGMKWGVDANEDGKIDGWKMISAVEVAEEVYRAIAAQNFNRLRALFINEAELASLKLSTAETEQIRKQLAASQAKFQEAIGKLKNLTEKAQFVRVETTVPQLKPASGNGPAQDVIWSPSRLVLYQGGDGKHEWLHSGAMVQVGQAWRLLDAPGPGDMPPNNDYVNDKNTPPSDLVLVKLQEKLAELEKGGPPPPSQPGPNAATVAFCQKRGELLNQILPRLKDATQLDMYTKQSVENLCTWAQCSAKGDTAALQRLTQFAAEKTKSGSPLASYAAFRLLLAEYMPKISMVDPDLPKWQVKWYEALVKFVQTYPKTAETPEALNYLAMAKDCGGGKESDDEAKRWYQQLVTNFPEDGLAAKARGCIARLELVGRPLQLTAPTLGGPVYDVAQKRGKVVVVYYWTSTCSECIGDFARLKQLQATYGSKGLEIVGVNLDDKAEDAKAFLQSNSLPVPHLFQAGGLSGPLAGQYGIMSLPTTFLVGKDGNVINRSLQINDLEDAVKKAL